METSELPTYTTQELLSYDGSEEGPIYVAIKGILYDVTKSRHLYGPGGVYHVFAGKECARALAMFSLNEKDCTNELIRLDVGQLAALEEWIQKFRRKYTVVGKINDSFMQRLINYLAFG